MQKRSGIQAGNTAQGWRGVSRVFITVACLWVVGVAVAYVVGLKALRLNQDLAEQSEEIRKLEAFVSILKDAETGQRGYLLTSDEHYLEPYAAAQGKINRELTELKQLGAEGRLGARDVGRVADLTQKKLAELEETIRLRRERGLDAALEIVRTGRGEQLMDDIRLTAEQMQGAKRAEFNESNRRAVTANFQRTIVFVFVAVVNLAFLGWAYRWLGREVVQREAAMRESQKERELLATTLASIGDGVIVTDAQGRVTLLNAEAERMTGWGNPEAGGKPLSDVFRIENEKTGGMVENPVEKVLRLGKTVGLANHTVLVSRAGNRIPIGDSGAPVRRPEGPVEGVVLVFRDVTGERNAQAARERLATIVESADDAMISKTLDGTILTWNQGAERMFGYSTEEAVGKPIMMIIPPERAHEESHILGCIRRGERVEHLETVRLASDGRQLDVSLSVSPLKDEEGCVVGASKVLRDITDRKKMEAELAVSREKLERHAQELERTVMETQRERELLATTLASIGDGVIVTDAQGRVTLLNGEAERMTGWGNAEAGGKPLSDVFKIENEKTGEMVENPVEKVLRLGKTVGLANHTVLVSRTGNRIPIGDSGAPVRRPEGPVEGVVLVFRDVTGERNFQATRERLAAIVDSAGDAMISKTLDGTILTWNQGAERILGYSMEEAVGKPIMMIIPPERAHEESHILGCIRRGERIEHLETVRLASDGRQVEVSLAVSPLRDEEGRVVGASKVLRDITDRKKMEAELAASREKLERHAQELGRTVTERTKQLRRTVAELEAFCYSLSHDMRAPLRAIQSYSQMVLAEAGGTIGLDCADYLGKVISAAGRLDQLIQDVLAFTRLSRQEITLEPLDVDRLVREIVQERLEFNGSKADVLIESPLLKMRGHGASLTQCVTNLLDNAVKFVAPGVKPCVRVSTEQQAGTVRLCFQDNGIGIGKQFQGRLFGLFQRMHHADQYQGTGIGLAIVRQAAERMEGQAGFESEPGRGSKFWVELPGVDS